MFGALDFEGLPLTSDSIAAWYWDFGDGSPKVKDLSASHYYFYPGEYRVTMTVTLTSGDTVLNSYANTVTIKDFIPNLKLSFRMVKRFPNLFRRNITTPII